MSANFVSAISSLGTGANPTGTPAANNKPPSEKELRDQAKREQQFQTSLVNASAVTGRAVNGEVVSEAQAKLGEAPSASKIAREGGGSLRDQQASLPGQIQQQGMVYQFTKLQLAQGQQGILAEYQQLQQAVAAAEAQGLAPDPALTERMNQLAASSQELEKQGAKLEEDYQSNTLALFLRADEIANKIKDLAKQTTAFLKDASSKIGQSNQKPVKVRPANFTIESGDGGEE